MPDGTIENGQRPLRGEGCGIETDSFRISVPCDQRLLFDATLVKYSERRLWKCRLFVDTLLILLRWSSKNVFKISFGTNQFVLL